VTTATSRAGISRVEDRLRASGALRAFTIVEVIAALVIASIALLGLLQLHLTSIRTTDTARTMALAVLVAQEKAAETASAGWPAVGAKSGTTEMDGAQFNWRTEVTSVDVPASGGLGRNALRQLSVSVTWQDGPGPRTVQTTTYLADHRIP
jgi:type II secretion system protein I